MSIRSKLTITILSVFILNTLLMVGCYKFILYPKLSKEIETKQNILYEYLSDITKEINNSNSDNIKKILENLKLDENMILVLDDINGNTLYESDKKLIGELNITSSKIVSVNNKSYLITLIEYLKIDNVKNIPVVEDYNSWSFITLSYKCYLYKNSKANT